MSSALEPGVDPFDLFSTVAAARMAEVTYRQLEFWSKTGVIRAAVPPSGSGTRARWSGQQIAIAAVLGQVSRVTNRVTHLGPLVAWLNAWPVEDWDGTVLVDPTGQPWRPGDGSPMVALSINLSAVRARLALRGVVWA